VRAGFEGGHQRLKRTQDLRQYMQFDSSCALGLPNKIILQLTLLHMARTTWRN
jgi:hypothetical protein